jgi:hypothetical protein
MTSLSRRRFVQTTSAASVAMATGFSGLAKAQSTVALRLSSAHLPDLNSSHFAWQQLMEANLKKAVGDKIRIDYFPNNQLGKESDVVQQVKVGSIDMMLTGSSIWATVTPQLGMLDLGYLFDSYEHVAKALDSGVGARLNEMLQKRHGLPGHHLERALRRPQRLHQAAGQVAGRHQERQAARAADAGLYRDLQDHGRHPHADFLRRALHGRADRRGRRL